MTIFFGTIVGSMLTLLIVPVGYLTIENLGPNLKLFLPKVLPWIRNFTLSLPEYSVRFLKKLRPRFIPVKLHLPGFPKRKEKEKQEHIEDEF